MMNLCNCFGKNNDLLLIILLYCLLCGNGCDDDCKGHGCLGC